MLVQVRTVPKHRSTHIPNYQSTNVNHISMMKTSLTIFPCVLRSAFLYIRVCPGLSFATKRIGPPFCTLSTFVTCCSLQSILSRNYLLALIHVPNAKFMIHVHMIRVRYFDNLICGWTGAWVMTHKYRGSIVVLSISKSVEPNEEQKEMISGFQQGILCKY